jgi:hypothetical protein
MCRVLKYFESDLLYASGVDRFQKANVETWFNESCAGATSGEFARPPFSAWRPPDFTPGSLSLDSSVPVCRYIINCC